MASDHFISPLVISLAIVWTFTDKCMDCRTLVRKSIHFFANFEVFEWLYLVQYWPNYHET